MKKVFLEMGIGNGSFFSTEFESRSEGDEDTEPQQLSGSEGVLSRARRTCKANVEGENEYRVPRFIRPDKIDGYYLRFWIFKTVFILSTNHGFEMKKKDRNKLKLLFGIGGTSA